MNLVLFTHPAYLGLQSQTRLVQMMAGAFAARGHRVEVRQPATPLRNRLPTGPWSKWTGYLDQYLLFPRALRPQLAADPPDTLYVFCDQALGPWIPLVQHRPHVVHCLDLLALRSALGQIPENPTSATGRLYQRWIRAGYRRARHFISISQKTRADLHTWGEVSPLTSEVVYLGLNHPYRRLPREQALQRLWAKDLPVPHEGVLMHVGGGQWYKNAIGVVGLYSALVRRRFASGRPVMPLWMVSPSPGDELRKHVESVPAPGAVRFLQGVDNDGLEALYSVSHALLFPSLAEGFGWPIAEAMACGCPVVTTGEPPMNEVGGPHAHYLPRLASAADLEAWSLAGAERLDALLERPAVEREADARAGIEWTRRFDSAMSIERYLEIYRAVLAKEEPGRTELAESA